MKLEIYVSHFSSPICQLMENKSTELKWNQKEQELNDGLFVISKETMIRMSKQGSMGKLS